MTAELWILLALGTPSFFVKGLTGAASAIVFNAILLCAIALGWAGDLTLIDGLLWMAVADLVASVSLAMMQFGNWRIEKLTSLLLAGMLPVMAVFAWLLPRVDVSILTPILALAVTGAGVWLLMRKDGKTGDPKTLARWAFPIGLIAGVFGGLFGMAGPIFILLLSKASDDTKVFRGRAIVITTAGNLVRISVLSLDQTLTLDHAVGFLWTAPAILGALVLGMICHKWVKPRPFRVLLGLLVMLAGLGSLIDAIMS